MIPDLAPELDGVTAVFGYVDLGADLVRALKFANRRTSLRSLVRAAMPALPTVDVVVPVPAEARRRRSRGYDLPELTARRVAREVGVGWDQPLRRADHGSQRGRRRLERERGAGYVARRPATGRILLVDDVVTTGATARSCARELRRVGADRVWLFTLAATPPRRGASLPGTATIPAYD